MYCCLAISFKLAENTQNVKHARLPKKGGTGGEIRTRMGRSHEGLSPAPATNSDTPAHVEVGGGAGTRTLGAVTPYELATRCLRPLGHTS